MIPILHNTELDQGLQELVARWGGNPGAVLRLYRNDFEPDPDSVLTDFQEANWAGYAAVALAGQLSAPVKLELGVWQSESGLYEYHPPAAPPGNLVYGAYVEEAGTVRASVRFDAPITMNPGYPPFRLRLHVQTKSESVFSVS